MAKIITILFGFIFCSCVNANFLWDILARRLITRGRRLFDSDNSTTGFTPFNTNTIQLIENHGYPAESHEVRTEDGYLLTIHRIPYGQIPHRGERPVVLLHHGILASSALWVLRGPDKDLAFILADNGYDVWMSNCRGNYYSRNHVTLDPDRDKKFWKYSFHEIGYYDVPATIDYILNMTGQSSLFYIGHSMGAGVFFVMASMRPEYNSKIRHMQGLAPAAYIVHKPSHIMKFLISNGPAIATSLRIQGFYEILPLRQLFINVGKALCDEESPLQALCIAGIFLIVGIDDQQLNNTLVPFVLNHFPAGGSLYQFLHFLQGIVTADFRQMDYGENMNLIKYHQRQPPEYDMDKVTAPVSLYYGDGDFLITREDVEMLAHKLPNVVGNFRVPFPYFNHLDFLLSHDSKTLLYDQLLTIMNKYRYK